MEEGIIKKIEVQVHEEAMTKVEGLMVIQNLSFIFILLEFSRMRDYHTFSYQK
jgi:hypothetical protein